MSTDLPDLNDPALDPSLRMLADHRRRIVLQQLRAASGPVEVEALIDAVLAATDGATHRDHVAVSLHHVHLPKLAGEDLVDHDGDRRRIRYTGDEVVTRLLDVLDEPRGGE